MTTATALVCDDCATVFPFEGLATLCTACGGLLEVTYDLGAVPRDFRERAAASREEGMWRWRALLPLPPEARIVSLGEGNTPLVAAPALGARLGVPKLYIKNDGVMPTGSFKDRGFSLAISYAHHYGLTRGYTYSSGNAGASFAAYCGRAGIDGTVFVEYIANDAKVAAIQMLGAKVFRLRYTSSVEIFDTLTELTRAGEYTFVNFINPIRHEAMKVYAYEICESLGWRCPDVMIHPVGTGGGIWGAWKGFQELHSLGLIDRLPRMIGVQPEACAPLEHAFQNHLDETVPIGDVTRTIAQSIAGDDMIAGGRRALRAVRDSGGGAVAVSDDDVLDAVRDLGTVGVLAEPSAAVGIAALTAARAHGWVHEDDLVVDVVTGTLLKQTETALQAAPAVRGTVRATVAEFRSIIEGTGD